MNQLSAKSFLRSIMIAGVAVFLTATTFEAHAQMRGGPGRGGFEEGRGGRGERDRDDRGWGDRGGRDDRGGRGDRGGRERDIRNRYEAERLVELIYRGALNRSADRDGLEYHVRIILQRGEQGLIDVARGIGSSDEMRRLIRREGSGRVIDNIYYTFFSRRADAEGYRAWKAYFDRGNASEALAGIVASPEFRRRQLN